MPEFLVSNKLILFEEGRGVLSPGTKTSSKESQYNPLYSIWTHRAVLAWSRFTEQLESIMLTFPPCWKKSWPECLLVQAFKMIPIVHSIIKCDGITLKEEDGFHSFPVSKHSRSFSDLESTQAQQNWVFSPLKVSRWSDLSWKHF